MKPPLQESHPATATAASSSSSLSPYNGGGGAVVVVARNDSYSSVQSNNTDKQKQQQLDTSTTSLRQHELEIAGKESKHVFVSRLVVVAVLVLSALCVSLAVYFYLTAAEQAQFVSQYDSDATKVLESLGIGLDHTIGSADAFVVKLVAYARYSNSTWPFVTLPDFYVQATKFLRLSQAFSVTVEPLIAPNEVVAEWEAYADANNGWIDESLALQRLDGDYHGPSNNNEYYTTRYEIHNATTGQAISEPQWCINDDHDCRYMVGWQRAPVVIPTPGRAVYNGDEFRSGTAETAEGMLHALQTSQAVVIANVEWHQEEKEERAQAQEQLANYLPPGEDVTEPLARIVYPIIPPSSSLFEKSSRILLQQSRAVGILSFHVRWVELLRNILPSNSFGIVVVFSQGDDDCGPSFTYELNGPNAVFRGMGDLHEDDTTHYAYLANLGELMGSTTSYTGLPLSQTYCTTQRVAVYPSAAMKATYHTSYPAIMAVVAALIFVFTSLVFLLYDVLVARRQRIVLNRAIASGKIVSSLFPEAVKQKLYQEQEKEQELRNNQGKFLATSGMMVGSAGSHSAAAAAEPSLHNDEDEDGLRFASSSLSSFHGGGASTTMTNNNNMGKPIAELYPATTVLLADLSGFTKWSADRTPAQVFELLETLYGEFDKLALQRKVFKVETIGECYVAVTGIPDPQKDHAVRMVRFATAMRHEMHRIITSLLVDRLGTDTMLLGLRVGMHSGPITAGVLRGEKARFQLFGDTINTASRMETNGLPEKIHISQETANEIIALGKGHWLTPRTDKIVAKGKGELQTYWVNTTTNGGGGLSGHNSAATAKSSTCCSGDLSSSGALQEASLSQEIFSPADTTTTRQQASDGGVVVDDLLSLEQEQQPAPAANKEVDDDIIHVSA